MEVEDFIMLAAICAAICIVVGSTIPVGELHTITGYLNDVDHDTGYGCSQTSLIIDNQSHIFTPIYRGTVYVNQEVIVNYRNWMFGKNAKIEDIQKASK